MCGVNGMFEKFSFTSLDEIESRAAELGVRLHLSKDLSALGESADIGGRTAPNRILYQPMEGCDGTAGGAPSEDTVRRYIRLAHGGAGVIWAEATAVAPEGRANPRQLYITEDNLGEFSALAEAIKKTCRDANGYEPLVILQLTHSGRYSKPNGVPEPLIAYNDPIFEQGTPIDKSRILSDDYLAALAPKFGVSAALAQRAGFDGADIKCCHRYLLSETMSAFTRPGKYGGSYENRTRLYFDAVRAAKAAVTGNFIITSRFNAYDGFEYPYGFGVKEGCGLEFDPAEAVKTASILTGEFGMKLLNVTAGNPYFNPHVNRPYDRGGYIPDENPLRGVERITGAAAEIHRQLPQLNVACSGISYLREFSPYLAAGMVGGGFSQFAGFGRMSLAYPDLARDILTKGALDPKKCCLTCSRCTELMRMGCISGCVVRDSAKYAPIYAAARAKIK
jgi:2,4-dienoyl-CoA reductase-like NADH-dependent reductase (Old Yellow Enzyme family)